MPYSKVNFLRGDGKPQKRDCRKRETQYVTHIDSFCGPKSYYANQDVFCNLKPKDVSANKQTHKIYTKEL